MLAQSKGNYLEALQNYYEAMWLEVHPYDQSYILYNIRLIHISNGTFPIHSPNSATKKDIPFS